MQIKNVFNNAVKKVLIIFIVFSFLIAGTGCSKNQLTEQKKPGNETEATASAEFNKNQDTENPGDTEGEVATTEQTNDTAQDESSEEEENTAINYVNDFALAGTEGKQIALSDFAGRIVVLNFWATWCPPCKAEIPDFVEVSADYEDQGVAFFGVSLDDDINALKQFIYDYDITYPIAIDNQIANVAGMWGISAIPTTFFIDIDGKILDKWVGQIPKKELKAIIDGYLGRSKA